MTKTEFHLLEALEHMSRARCYVEQVSETYPRSNEKFSFRGDLLNISANIRVVLNNIRRVEISHAEIQADPAEQLLETRDLTRNVLKEARDFLNKFEKSTLSKKPKLTIVRGTDET